MNNEKLPDQPVHQKHFDQYDDLLKLSASLAEKGLAKNTRTAYQADFSRFAYFCARVNLPYLPATPDTVCAYLASLIDKKYPTISRVCVSIKRFHLEAGYDSPTDSKQVLSVLKGIRREVGISCISARPILWSQICDIAAKSNQSIRERRNISVLMLGWCGALRRSEIVGMNVQDLSFLNEGIAVRIKKSKTDQEGKGVTIFIPKQENNECSCFNILFKYVLFITCNQNGPLFRRVRKTDQMVFYNWQNESRLTEQSISDIVKESVQLIGLDPAEYSAHSLRRGFATECGRLGIPERFIARQTRHKSMEVLRRYIDDGSIMLNNPLTAVFSGRGPDSSLPLESRDRHLAEIWEFLVSPDPASKPELSDIPASNPPELPALPSPQ